MTTEPHVLMTAQERAAAQKRCEQATKGEWFAAARQGDDWKSVVCLNERYEICQCFHERGNEDECEANAEFIVDAHNNYPRALADLTALHSLVGEQARALSDILARFPDDEAIHELEADNPSVARPCPIEGTPSYFTDKQILKWRDVLARARVIQGGESA